MKSIKFHFPSKFPSLREGLGVGPSLLPSKFPSLREGLGVGFLVVGLSVFGTLTASAQDLTQSIGMDNPATAAVSQKPADFVLPGSATTRSVQMGKKVFEVADQTDTRRVYRDQVKADKCFIVISKQEYRLYVYEVVGKDTLLVAHYPVCLSKVRGNKQRVGDMKTPECTPRNPFHISQIQPASSWKHDFKDGRGNIPSYGAWFMRLVTPGHSGIGIHGSTSNESSVPGRDSEGCIRLRDDDIKHLKENYARVGTRVIIKSDFDKSNCNPYPFEQRAWKAAKDFRHPINGYTLLPGARFVNN